MVKYRVQYRDTYNQLCRIDILKESYSGVIIPLRGVAGKGCVISRDCDDDPYSPIINTKAAISLYVEKVGQVDVLELQQAQDREFRVECYVEDVLKFTGFLIPDGIQGYLKFSPYELTLNATDGLMLLDNIPYVHNNLLGGRNVINYLRQILFASSNLNLPLPIRWVNYVRTKTAPLVDFMSGSLPWAARGEGFLDSQGNYKSCYYILENLIRSMQSRLYQEGGKWVVWRINDVVGGSLIHREITGSLNGYDIVIHPEESYIKTIGDDADLTDYVIKGDSPVVRVSPGLRSVKTTYAQDQNENILPNGDMDIFVFGAPLYWGLTNPNAGTLSSANSLSNSKGTSIKISNNIGGLGNIFWLTDGGLPIDTDALYSYINFGFKFSISSGAVVDSNGYILWDQPNARFNIQVVYKAGTKTYYLNEFGFWTENFSIIYPEINQLKMGDVAQVDFNAHQNIIMPLPDVSPIGATNYPSVNVIFNLQSNIVMYLDDIYLQTNTNSDVYEVINMDTSSTDYEEYTLKISTSHNGFYVSNYMTTYANSGVEKMLEDKVHSGTLTEINSHAIMRNRYKSSLLIDASLKGKEYSYSELYNIKSLDGRNFLPLKSSWNIETNTVEITVIEVRDDNVALSVSRYGTNDNTQLNS